MTLPIFGDIYWLKTRAKTQKINFIFRQKQDTNLSLKATLVQK